MFQKRHINLKTYKAIMYELHCIYKDLQRKHDDLKNMVEAEKNNYEEMVKAEKNMVVADKENGMNIEYKKIVLILVCILVLWICMK